jgi:HK97 family phage major capsid protein
LNPREIRAKADQERAKAQAIYDRHKGVAAPEFTEDELRDFDAATREADRLYGQADEFEAREKRMNDLDARSKANADPRSADRTGGRDLPHNDGRNTRDGRHGYSLLKALRQSDPMQRGGGLDGIELEVHQELAKDRSRAARGTLVPWDLPVDTEAVDNFRSRNGMERRDLTTSTGVGAVYTTVSTNMIELLRNKMLARQLGVRVMANMQGNFTLPRQTAGGTAYWVTEGNAPTETNQTIGAVTFSPNTLGAFSDYSRQFLHQTSVDAEQFVRDDLTAVIAIELDRAVFNGAGSGAEPQGIIGNSNVNVVSINTNGGALTWAKVIEMEKSVETQNALNGSLAFVTSPAGRASLKAITRVPSSTFGDFLWADNATVNGYAAFSSNQIPVNLSKGTSSGTLTAAIFGDWSQVILAMWGGGMDTLVDPYTGGTAGNVRIITLTDADIDLRQPKALSVIKDLLPS